jgi:hypothetical protein
MASCEKCWEDAGGNPDVYKQLIKERNCTPEEQAGEYSEMCQLCNRKTIHQYTHKCINPECNKKEK